MAFLFRISLLGLSFAVVGFASASFSSALPAQTLPAQTLQHQAPPEPDGMRTIFNGHDLTGWDGDPRLWTVRDGVIRGETTADKVAKGNTFLIWRDGQLDDFELRLSFRCNDSNNSGIQYRSKHVTGEDIRNPWVVRGYQHEIRNELTFPNVSGFIYDEGGERKRICLVGEQVRWDEEGKQVLSTFLDQEAFHKLFRLDDWNDVVIRARGNHIQHFLNGSLIVDFTDVHPEKQLLKGVLALQLHAGKPMWVEFKDLRLKQF